MRKIELNADTFMHQIEHKAVTVMNQIEHKAVAFMNQIEHKDVAFMNQIEYTETSKLRCQDARGQTLETPRLDAYLQPLLWSSFNTKILIVGLDTHLYYRYPVDVRGRCIIECTSLT